ncbi:MAG: GNAT family N-acetyltransferase [Thermomicrobiales bacterium]
MANIEPVISPLRPGEQSVLEAIIARALHFEEPGRMAYWMAGAGPEHYRVVRAGGRPVGGLAILRAGQWFGGQRVPMAGIGSLGIAPEWRGRGAASALLRGTLSELHETGIALATLYPSTLPVYRKAGFEHAGNTLTYELTLAGLNPRPALDVVPIATDEWQTLVPIRNRWVQQHNGGLDRNPFMWQKTVAPFGQEAYAYLIRRGDTPEGYFVYSQAGRKAPLQVLDWCVLDREAGLTFLAFLASDRAMTSTATLRGAPAEPILQLLPEPGVTINRLHPWLLRIVDVAGALRARGSHPALTAELHFAVTDDLLPANCGNFVLRISAGRGDVVCGGTGQLRLDVRALAALYTSFLTAEQLASIGALAGSMADLALASLVFAGPPPRLVDAY